jgi:hypothetical protein
VNLEGVLTIVGYNFKDLHSFFSFISSSRSEMIRAEARPFMGCPLSKSHFTTSLLSLYTWT